MAYYYGEFFPPAPRREAKGGIKAQSRRGGFGQSWWAQRWVEYLESLNIGGRFSRSKTYARQGQVLSIDIDQGAVTARVQGSYVEPYQIRIAIKTLDASDSQKLTQALLAQPVFMAQLLTGQMPDNIEDVFRDAELSLFPDGEDDLVTDCTCPDWANPCKHIGAVYLLLGEEFDRDPFLIFRLRGIEIAEILGWVGNLAGSGSETGEPEAPPASLSGQTFDLAPEPLPVDPDAYWGGACTDAREDTYGLPHIPPVPAVLPKRLGSFPFWRGQKPFIPALEEIYRQASPAGQEAFLGARQDPEQQGS